MCWLLLHIFLLVIFQLWFYCFFFSVSLPERISEPFEEGCSVYMFYLGLSILHSLIFCTLISCGYLCLSLSTINIIFSEEDIETYLSLGMKKNKSWQDGSLIYSFNGIIIVGFLLGFIIHLSIGYWTTNYNKYGFHFVEQALNSIRKCLITSMTFLPLLHQWTYLASHYYSSQ